MKRLNQTKWTKQNVGVANYETVNVRLLDDAVETLLLYESAHD